MTSFDFLRSVLERFAKQTVHCIVDIQSTFTQYTFQIERDRACDQRNRKTARQAMAIVRPATALSSEPMVEVRLSMLITGMEIPIVQQCFQLNTQLVEAAQFTYQFLQNGHVLARNRVMGTALTELGNMSIATFFGEEGKRLANSLRFIDIDRVSDLLEASIDLVQRTPNIGTGQLAALHEYLARHGLYMNFESREKAKAFLVECGKEDTPAVSEETLAASVVTLGFPKRVQAHLTQAGIYTVKDLIAKNEVFFWRMEGFGPNSMRDLKATLSKHNLVLAR